MQINCSELVDHKSVEEIWETIKLKYDEMVRKFVPIVRFNSKTKLPFMSKDITNLINKRERLFRVY